MFWDILQHICNIIAHYLSICALILTFWAQLCHFFSDEFENIAEGIVNAPLPLNLIPKPYEILPENAPEYK
jgi:hypothetical protein